MHTMKRRLLILIATTSLICFGATLCMMMRSAFKSDEVGRWLYNVDLSGATYGQDHFSSFGGRLDYQGYRIYAPAPGHERRGAAHAELAPEGWTYLKTDSRNFLMMWLIPFRFDRQVSQNGNRVNLTFDFAYWVPLLIFASVAWFSLAKLRRHRRLRGHCHACGYDLCATPERCPECGSEQTAAKQPV